MNVLAVAIAMEVDLEQYYLKQAEINKGNSLDKMFIMLAKDEREHADLLRKRADKLNYELEASETLVESKKLFENMEDFEMEIKAAPIQLDAVRMALDMEKKSIDAYGKMLSETDDKEAKELFEFLIKQEQEHFDLLEELVFHLSKPEEWVEDAEFTKATEY